ncbi:glutaminase A [Aeromicrobium sp. PE09-221]|uniref:glutaminase A n=1 Tax=Aeromicrobium sp. PE09-221 TaxID=1898043 RepID=UPI000B3E6FEE|nr:glutaminase A [Aeromicrobium sp. PE09-221]OUZ08872.1 glutaminase A [Aeromicrobium sp. PE09-221]
MSRDPIVDALTTVLDDVREDTSGEVADYIPELASADADALALVLVAPHGEVHAAGDADRRFTIQSISKPFAFALALQTLGRDEVLERVGVEPSGEPFNAISLEPDSGKPANPMINAGAIATTAMAPGSDVEEKTASLLSLMSACAGRDLSVDEDVYTSESQTGERNRGIAHLLASYRAFDCGVDTAVETYFRQCSTLVDAKDVATMAATLAFGGRNPATGEQALAPEVTRDVVAVMSSCGMYDASGRWTLRVGLPAKSGVAGGVIAVDPSEFGVAAFSPRLDRFGNSVRGVRALEEISRRFGLHMLADRPETSSPVVDVDHRDDTTVVRLHGHINFGTAAQVAHRMREEAATARLTLDLRDTERLDESCGVVLRRVADDLDAAIEE